MTKRPRKLISIRRRKLRVKDGKLSVTNRSARIGGKVGANISKTGISFSTRTPIGTISTKKYKWFGGQRRQTKRSSCACCPLMATALAALASSVAFFCYEVILVLV